MIKLVRIGLFGAAALALGTAGVALASQHAPKPAAQASVDNQKDGETADDAVKATPQASQAPDAETADDAQGQKN